MKRSKLYTYTVIAAMGLGVAQPVAQSAESESRQRNQSSTQPATGKTKSTALGNVERADRLIGMNVEGADRQNLGEIKDLALDLESGRVLFVILDSGNKDVALPPEIFTQVRGNRATLNVDKAKITDAPEVTRDRKSADQLKQASFVHQVYTHFGQNPWWQGSVPADQGNFNNVHLASSLPNMSVKNVSNQDMGEVRNTMIDLTSGRVLFVVLVPDRDLDLGENYFALPPNALTLGSDKKHLVSDISREKLAGAPKFGRNDWNTLASTSFASRVYQYYGKQAYFQTQPGNLQPTGRDAPQVYPDRGASTNKYWDSQTWDDDVNDPPSGSRRGLFDPNRDDDVDND